MHESESRQTLVFDPGVEIGYLDGNPRRCVAGNLQLVEPEVGSDWLPSEDGEMGEAENAGEGGSRLVADLVLTSDMIARAGHAISLGYSVDLIEGVLYGPDHIRRSANQAYVGALYRYTFRDVPTKINVYVAVISAMFLWGAKALSPGMRLVFVDGDRGNHRALNLRLYTTAGREVVNQAVLMREEKLLAALGDGLKQASVNAEAKATQGAQVTVSEPVTDYTVIDVDSLSPLPIEATSDEIPDETFDAAAAEATHDVPPAEPLSGTHDALLEMLAAVLGVGREDLADVPEEHLVNLIQTAIADSAQARGMVRTGLSRDFVVRATVTVERVVHALTVEEAVAQAGPLEITAPEGWRFVDGRADATLK